MKAILIIVVGIIILYVLYQQSPKAFTEGFTKIKEGFKSFRTYGNVHKIYQTLSQKYNIKNRQSPDFTSNSPGPGSVPTRRTSKNPPVTIPNGTYLKAFDGAVIDHQDIPLPTTFNEWARNEWTLPVLYQNACGDCWAFAICEMMASRLCIVTQGKIRTPMSTQYLNSCYNGTQGAMGCAGGIPEPVMRTIKQYGIISNAAYPYRETSEYTLPCTGTPARSCIYKIGAVNPLTIQAPNGPPDENQLNLSLVLDRTTINHNVQQMKTDIYLNGPIVVGIDCYEDLYTIPNDPDYVYIPNLYSTNLGGHAVLIIGWGTNSKGVDYWIVQNSWGTDWGYGPPTINGRSSGNSNTGGYWNHIMGRNACEIEAFAVSGMPNLTDPCVVTSLPATVNQYTQEQLATFSGVGQQTIRSLIS